MRILENETILPEIASRISKRNNSLEIAMRNAVISGKNQH
jgi:hypothetical protein